jgi:arsenate reductase (thioredoxin)
MIKKMSADRKKVLFVCIHNSARSQMAEALLNAMAPDRFEAQSAGIEPGTLNPAAVDVMKDAGIDISLNKTKSVRDFIKEGRVYDYVITVCDETSAERCPVFPGGGKRMHMGFEDPSVFDGSYKEKFNKTKAVRDQIKTRLEQWIKELGND